LRDKGVSRQWPADVVGGVLASVVPVKNGSGKGQGKEVTEFNPERGSSRAAVRAVGRNRPRLQTWLLVVRTSAIVNSLLILIVRSKPCPKGGEVSPA